MTDYSKPVPFPDLVTARYWEAAREGKLLIQSCADCGVRQFFPHAHCRSCLSENVEWIETSGRGKVYSYTVVHRAPSAQFQEDAPYVVALVELDEGVRMMSNIVGIEPSAARIGMDVEVVFEEITQDISLPKFRPSERA